MRLTLRSLSVITLIFCGIAPFATAQTGTYKAPRTPDGKPDFTGIWQVEGDAEADLQDHDARLNMPAGRSVIVGGGAIPYLPEAAKQKAENFKDRQTADPVAKCFIPGVPRIMYINFPFQIFQTPKAVTMAFEWSLDYRLIHTDGSKHPADLETWMGDSRGHWEGDTLVVDVAGNNDQTWLDMAGDYHSEALHVVERYTMTAPDTIQYEATLEDPKVFSKPWTIKVAMKRRTDRDRLFEYACQAESEEANGLFEREDRTWYPGPGTQPGPMVADMLSHAPNAPKEPADVRRMPDGKPDLQGVYQSNAGGASQGLEKRTGDALTPAGRGIVVDPADGKLPLQPWAVEERVDRNTPERGYDDPTAHSFPPGTPRAMHVPAALEIVQTPDYVVFLHERMAWRIIPLNGRAHIAANMRLWQGDNVGHWDGDTLVIDTTNLNGKAWLSEGGDIISYAAHVVERITPAAGGLSYEATVYDPVVYSRPWTVAYPVRRVNFELPEAASHEEDRDLPHLKLIKDQAAAKKKAAAASTGK